MIYLSSKDASSMVKVIIHEIQFTTRENKENRSIPSNIPWVKVGTIQRLISQI